MSAAVRRLISVVVVAAIALVGVLVYRGSSGSDPAPVTRGGTTTVNIGPSDVVVDSPDLQALKAEAGIADCVPGTATASDLPSVTLPCLGGGASVDLASLRGPMLLSFWQSACGPCREEIPALEAFDQQYGDQVPVVGVDFLDVRPGSALNMMRRFGGTYPSLADPGGDLQATPQFAKIGGYPTLYFIDAKGQISFVHPGGLNTEDEVVDLVRQHLGVDL